MSEVSFCGGCNGMGGHKRWCSRNVGMRASYWGKLSEKATALGDEIGSNNPGLANVMYQAGGEMRERAFRLIVERERQIDG